MGVSPSPDRSEQDALNAPPEGRGDGADPVLQIDPGAQGSASARPVDAGERILSLDVLRGVAVLGILVMNIQAFSQVAAAYSNPYALGELVGLQFGVWVFTHLFFEQKFLSVFSILFGAGVYLMTQRADSRGDQALMVHLRRMMWLVLFGLVHAYLFWWGDILFSYAVCGALIFPFRQLQPRVQLLLAAGLVCVCPLLLTGMGLTLPFWPEEVHREAVQQWEPTAEQVVEEIETYRGSWFGQLEFRIPAAFALQTYAFFLYSLWRVMAMMFLGIVLFRWGVLSGEVEGKWLRRLGIFGFGLGFPLVTVGILHNRARGFDHDFSVFFGFQYNYWGSVLVALGYIAVIVSLSLRSSFFRRLMAPVGRMALTNYLAQTLICTLLFYGHGFGLFAVLNRAGQLGVVLVLWVVQVVASHLWLRRYRFGPFEWLWRSLTYSKAQPMRVSRS
ncbi:MAG: DUF418 domain-containing protein [Acidobacteriota bacterium]